MRRFLWFITFLLLAGGAAAQTDASHGPAPSQSAATHRQVRVTVEEIRQLHDALAAQQKQSEEQRQQLDQLKSQLQQLLNAARQAKASAQNGQSSAEAQSSAAQPERSASEAQRPADQASTSAAEANTALSVVDERSKEKEKRFSTLEDDKGRFRFNGDIRVRGESFFQDGIPDRNRSRLRVRFGVDGKLGEDFVGGLALATGSLGDPTTNNETLTNFFDRKTIGLDRGYITYNPVAHPWLSLTGGKFAYAWNRTQVTGDPNINPEGFNEKLSWELNTAAVKNLAVDFMQLLFNESSTGTDSYALGGQISGKVQIGRLTTMPSFMAIKWNNPDSILQASAFALQATTTTGGLPVPGEGPGCSKGSGLPTVPPCAFGANNFTNATYDDPGGKPHFYSQFLYADFILNNQIRTSSDRWPINLLLEYENNLDAKDHPLAPTGVVLTGLGKQSHTYLVDISLGQTKTKNDIQVGYAWLREEQDAAIASFAENNQRAPTNALQNRWYALWKVRPNTVASYNLWVGRTLNSNLQHAVLAPGVTAGERDPYLKRMQFDLLYSF